MFKLNFNSCFISIDNSIKEENNISDSKQSEGLFKFGEKPSDSNSTFKIPQTFAFGQSSAAAPALPTFGSSTTDKPLFSFGTSNSGLFGANFAHSTPMQSKIALPTNTKENTEDNEGAAGGDEEDTPPKVTSVEHSEDDAVFKKK